MQCDLCNEILSQLALNVKAKNEFVRASVCAEFNASVQYLTAPLTITALLLLFYVFISYRTMWTVIA